MNIKHYLTVDAIVGAAALAGIGQANAGPWNGAFGASGVCPKPAKPEPNRRPKTKHFLGRAGNFG